MYCGKCGYKNNNDSAFCSFCGNKISYVEEQEQEEVEVLETEETLVSDNVIYTEQPQIIDLNIEDNIPANVNIDNYPDSSSSNYSFIQNDPNVNNVVNQNINNHQYDNQTKSNNRSLYIIIIIMGIILISLLIGVVFIINSSSNNSRTIMIYMAGCNLESEGGLASNDLKAILPEDIDLEKTNILVYAGGTKKWYNDFDANENAIYLLKSTGFEKIKTYNLTNLGDSSTFETFLDYSYNNYQADVFDLIFWDHGLGVLGSINDEYSDDFLSIAEMEIALKNSNFSKDKIIETVTFRTCLNGTIEVADTFAPYANYMIASEEITIGSSHSNVLSFLNNVENTDSGIEYGEKFIQSYKKQVEEIDFFGATDSTYSIIELDKVDELIDALGNFVNELDVKENYAQIARVRSNLHQYAEGSGCTDYDTVDLYQLVINLKEIAPDAADEVLTVFKDVIKYNWATNDFSNGISIYFPFKGSVAAQALHMNLYKEIDFNEEYYNFINTFYNTKSDSSVKSFNLQNKEIKNVGEKEFSLQLTEDELSNFASAEYTIFQKQEDGTFMPVVKSKNYKITDSGLLTTNVSNNILKVKDNDDGKFYYVQSIETSSTDANRQYIVPAILYSFNGEVEDWLVDSSNFDIRIDKNHKPYITKVMKIESDGLATRVLDLNNYSTVQFTNFRYSILDENGNYNENWGSQNTKYLIELDLKDIEKQIIVDSLDDADNYYCIFKIIDITNNYHYSNLIKIS